MPAGNLDGDLGDAGGMHVFVGSKAPWHTIADDSSAHDTVPPGWPLPASIGRRRPCSRAARLVLVRRRHLQGDGLPARMMLCHCSRCRARAERGPRGNASIRGAVRLAPGRSR